MDVVNHVEEWEIRMTGRVIPEDFVVILVNDLFQHFFTI